MAVNATSHSLRWPLKLLALALLGALVYLCVRIVITFTNPESIWQNNDFKASAPMMAAETSRNFAFTSDPFKSVSEVTLIDEEVLNEDVPETSLNLKMTGRISGQQGSAILRTSDNKEAVYKIGDEIISDVFLKAVNKDFVVLSVNGQLQRLTFERDENTGLTASVPAKLNASILPPNLTANQDILSLLQHVSLRRSMKNGRLEGYKVKSNSPEIDITQFGFVKGDIVTQIDGNNITKGRMDFLKLFQEASERGQVEVAVLRNGQNLKIKLGSN